jgi:hypothetical protein
VSRLYSKTFKIGFLATIAVFIVLNVVAYLSALRQYDAIMREPIQFGPAPRFPAWGVPFKWDGYNLPYKPSGPASDLFGVADGIVLNVLVIAGVGFLVGITLRWLTGRYE